MLLVETYLDFSEGKGIGLYASKFIKKGTVYWERNEVFDKLILKETVNKIDKLASLYIQKYGFQEITENWYLCSDNSRFTNHSKNSNSSNFFNKNGLLVRTYALFDIMQNDEILIDYSEICLTCKNGVSF